MSSQAGGCWPRAEPARQTCRATAESARTTNATRTADTAEPTEDIAEPAGNLTHPFGGKLARIVSGVPDRREDEVGERFGVGRIHRGGVDGEIDQFTPTGDRGLHQTSSGGAVDPGIGKFLLGGQQLGLHPLGLLKKLADVRPGARRYLRIRHATSLRPGSGATALPATWCPAGNFARTRCALVDHAASASCGCHFVGCSMMVAPRPARSSAIAASSPDSDPRTWASGSAKGT